MPGKLATSVRDLPLTLTKSPEGNVQPPDAVRRLLVLDEDRTLVDPLHNAFLACGATPSDEQLNTAFQAKET